MDGIWLFGTESGYFVRSLVIVYGVCLFCTESTHFVQSLVIVYGMCLLCTESGYFVRSLVILYHVCRFVRSVVIKTEGFFLFSAECCCFAMV